MLAVIVQLSMDRVSVDSFVRIFVFCAISLLFIVCVASRGHSIIYCRSHGTRTC